MSLANYSLCPALAEHEIGAEHLQKLRAVAHRLYGNTQLTFRIAPSIVVRGEAELFGFSVPRFACRVYLRPDSFVNVRRLPVLARSVLTKLEDMARADSETKHHFSSLYYGIEAPATNCAADCLLAPPPHLLDAGYHILTTDLGQAYGEGPILGTPFVCHLGIFGGGMCAQAVAFQATALWHEHAQGLYSVPEITMLADSGDPTWIDLGGMSVDKLIRYFHNQRVHLSAQYQFVDPSTPQQEARQFSEAVFSYVMSGIPVVLPVDLGRLNGTSFGGIPVLNEPIFERNNLPRDFRAFKGSRTMSHAVIIVGAHPAQDVRQFVLNDPATLPFLEASGAQLAEARRYSINGTTSLARPSYLPIAPAAIQLPLLSVQNQLPIRIGLLAMAEDIQQHGDPLLPTFKEPRYDPGSFRLVDLAQRHENNPSRFEIALAHIPQDAVEHLWRSVAKGLIPPQWCWIQYKRHRHGDVDQSLWVWDASQQPLTCNESLDRSKFLLAVSARRNQQWSLQFPLNQQAFHCIPTQEPNNSPIVGESPSASVPTAILEPALISSFAVEGIQTAAEHWNPAVGCELYLWMKADLEKYLNAGPKNEGDAVLTMAKLMTQSAFDFDSLADRLIDTGLPIVAFASFIPEITSSPNDKCGERAQRALEFIARLAIAVRERQAASPQLAVIEMVAGSRIDRIYRAQSLAGGDWRHLAKKMSDGEATRRIRINLLRGLGSELAGQLQEHEICFAFELEPGPLYALRDWGTVQDFVQMIDHHSELESIVGFNLDIAHWRIAGGDQLIEMIATDHLVRRRIVHAHIAGHHPKAHLGDIHLNAINDPASEFGPWIRLLRKIAAEERHRPLPRFSGYVSHEFEAAPDSAQVWNSLDHLRRLLAIA